MGHPYLLVPAPLSRVQALGGWEHFPGDLPGVESDVLIGALESCPFLRREGLTSWGEHLDEFTIEEGRIHLVAFEVHGANDHLPLGEIRRICAAVARRVGPVTLMGEDWRDRFEIAPE